MEQLGLTCQFIRRLRYEMIEGTMAYEVEPGPPSSCPLPELQSRTLGCFQWGIEDGSLLNLTVLKLVMLL